MKFLSIDTRIEVAENRSDLPASIKVLFEELDRIIPTAYAPYSNFKVGCVLLFEDGTTVSGTNQENASYPVGLCAERVALSAASSLKPGMRIQAMAISYRSQHASDRPVAPCGICRQTILEYEKRNNGPIEIWMAGQSGSVYKVSGIEVLLPLSFSSKDL